MRSVKWVWGTIVFLLACILVLSLLLYRSLQTPRNSGIQLPAESKHVVARIDAQEITYDQLVDGLIKGHGSQLLQTMVDRAVLDQESKSLGITIGRGDIDKELKRMQAGYEDEEQFYKSMKEQLGLSKENVLEDLKYKLLQERIATYAIRVTDAEVNQYISSHPEEFEQKTKYRAGKIVVKTKKEAESLAAEIGRGADFAELARSLSLDKATAAEGGDLGWINADDLFVPAPVMKALQQLKPGEVSKPVAVEEGYALLILRDKIEPSGKVDDSAREIVRRELALQKAPPMKELLAKLRTKHQAEIVEPLLK
ncbi:peptidylprolyl isomerase [Paenibacillus sp. y28]|uniref:peptidylprolyl isomerase n=1 Tax=Paenibacillus sp. y28 TaxID=3129110 RepID=UPI003017B833